MTNEEIMWLQTKGKIGSCDTCLFRKSIDEMNAELLPCNQYQCLVKLAKTAKTINAVGAKIKMKVSHSAESNTYKDVRVKNENRFNIISRQQLPIKIMNRAINENEINKRYVNKVFGVYHVLEFAGYELKEVREGRKTSGTEYINYIFKCQCTRCGSIRYLTYPGLIKAQQMKGACRNCWRIPNNDERLIQLGEEKNESEIK